MTASSAGLAVARRSRWFYASGSIVAAAVIFVGFARTYYLKAFFATRELGPLLHVHGFVMTCWMLLLVTQTFLVAKRRTDVHRKLGVAGAFLAAGAVVLGLTVSVHAIRAGHAPTGVPPLSFLIVPFGDIVLFAGLVSAAIWYRKRPEVHKRLMLVATVAILPPGIARWPWSFVAHNPARFFGVADLILIGCVLYDYTKTRRLSPAYVWGGSLLVLSHPLRLIFAHTAVWLRFAGWITGM